MVRSLSILLLLLLISACNEDEPETPPTTVADIDGNVYNTVTIGTQTWMAENLKTTKLNDGVPIPFVADTTEWLNLNDPAYCWYNNDQATYGEIYGALYNWYTVTTDKLCPTGWHVPTNEDTQTLFQFLDGPYVAGGKLKEAGTIHWESPNTDATNETGFTALPGGIRLSFKTDWPYWKPFNGLGLFGRWWQMGYDENLVHYPWRPMSILLEYNETTAISGKMAYEYPYQHQLRIGMSVRCIWGPLKEPY